MPLNISSFIILWNLISRKLLDTLQWRFLITSNFDLHSCLHHYIKLCRRKKCDTLLLVWVCYDWLYKRLYIKNVRCAQKWSNKRCVSCPLQRHQAEDKRASGRPWESGESREPESPTSKSLLESRCKWILEDILSILRRFVAAAAPEDEYKCMHASLKLNFTLGDDSEGLLLLLRALAFH